MIKFTVLTIFPWMFDPYLKESILARAIRNQKISVKTVDIRKYTSDRHHSVDDKPYGGGAGMLMKVEPIYRAVTTVTAGKSKTKSKFKIRNSKTRIILFSAKGKQFTQRDAVRLSKYENLIMICGRYEGVDERVAKYIADEEMSVGPYVLSGGELPALMVIDAISRLVSGVLGNPASLYEESFSVKQNSKFTPQSGTRYKSVSLKGKTKGLVFQNLKFFGSEYPQYTRPEVFYPNARNKKIVWKVPGVLLTGNHANIAAWRKKKTR